MIPKKEYQLCKKKILCFCNNFAKLIRNMKNFLHYIIFSIIFYNSHSGNFLHSFQISYKLY